MENFDIQVTSLSKRTNGLFGTVIKVHNHGVEAKLENGEVRVLRNRNFDYLTEKNQENSSQSENPV
jgi:hypothetical protein